ncbi:lipoprotein signal peptide [Salinivibrio sp. PR5]|uniref:alpha/beta hydrolase family protein n=1 Tax=Salinivibrio sp. PR5 TaxID=1909484 RepID=UPI00098A620C|nr:alpha/beta fold hydrolase [Salinivibrio sp. PR5]OOF11206.1 lipoprotein signal peptide [Salinivibrio sp. PR5]
MCYQRVLFTIFCLSSLLLQPARANSVGFIPLHIEANAMRPLKGAMWYPTDETEAKVLIGDNPAFIGMPVIQHASIDTKNAPLVILSHGYRGNWRNQSWLAYSLAQKGYIVAAINHPGTTTFNHNASQAAQWWQRPNDMSHLLDHLLSKISYRNKIDKQNITAIGHSLGGWTVMQLIGAQLDRTAFKRDCERYRNSRTCGLADELGLSARQDAEPASHNLSDPRIKRVVSLDLGLARSFSTTSLSSVSQPTLILAAGVDIGDLPQAMESGYLAKHIGRAHSRYKVYQNATHFSFIQACKPNAVALLEAEKQGDGIICQDGRGAQRSNLHQQIIDDIVQFLAG